MFIGFYVANNGVSCADPIKFKSKRQAISKMLEVAREKAPENGSCLWCVCETFLDKMEFVCSGRVHRTFYGGFRYERCYTAVK